jgi:hypothetical protein
VKYRDTNPPQRCRERGQAFLVVAVFVGVLLLVVLGMATDYSQIWAHRQTAQGAADAACQAGAADLFLNVANPSIGGTNGIQSFSWIGSTFTCAAKPNAPPCQYASFNGYSGANVSVSFPSSLPGVASLATGFGSIANPYIKVGITDPVPMFFTKLASSAATVNVGATSSCGMISVSVPIPLVVLHQTSSGSLSVGGTAAIAIFGGPSRAIQVESISSTAVSVGTINLSQAGPAGNGADFGDVGGPTTKPAGVNVGVGKWISPASPLGDPWATIPTPSAPGTNGTATPVPFSYNGCPDPVGCVEFTGGNYTACSANIAPGGNGCLISPNFSSGGPAWQASNAYTAGTLIQPTNPQHNPGKFIYQAQNAGTSGTLANIPNPWTQTIGMTSVDNGITWKNIGPVSNSPITAIFDPGLYYLGTSGLNPGSNTTMRLSTATGDGHGGVMFYFSTSAGTVSVGSNTGKSTACTAASPGSATPNNCVVSYKPDGSTLLGVTSPQLQCPSGPAIPSQVPATINGNILLGPCSGTYGGDSAGQNRGFLFFQNRSASAQPNWGGGGQFLLSGYMYFHSGSGATCGTNTTCLTMSGGSGAGGFAIGNIVVDKLSMQGNSTLNMILNATVAFQVLKPSLLQ